MIITRNLTKIFSASRNTSIAVDNVSLEIVEGQILGLVGESGSGKSTLGRLLLRLIEPSSGEIFFENTNLSTLSSRKLKSWRQKAQIIFQDPYASLNPRMTIYDILAEPLIIHKLPVSRYVIHQALEEVGLSDEHCNKYPYEFSGGQRQRIGIARALILKPRFIVCDEPITALDVSVQAQIINLLKEIQKKFGLTLLFISHDLRMVSYIADQIAVMHLGQIIEQGPPLEIFSNPQQAYTKELISAIPSLPARPVC